MFHSAASAPSFDTRYMDEKNIWNISAVKRKYFNIQKYLSNIPQHWHESVTAKCDRQHFLAQLSGNFEHFLHSSHLD